MSVADYNTDPNSNTSISGINIAEGCPPSGINNAIRQMMADVKTADNENVKLSKTETISGVKTFSSGIVVSTPAAIKRDVNNSSLNVYGGTAFVNGALISLHGKDDTDAGSFVVRASDGTNNKDLIGKPDGTLTWNNKNFVYDSGDQTIAGTKTFSATPVLSYSSNDTLLALRMDVTKGSNPSAQKNVTVCGFEKSGNLYFANRLMAWSGYVTTAGDTYSSLVAYKNASGSAATIFNTVYGKASDLSYHTTAMIRPNADNTYSCGTGSYRWSQVYAASATINTSDERLKDNIAPIPDAVLDAWGEVQWAQFQMRDAVAKKGENARIHNGLVAQRIDAVFKAHGLDASRYGLFCHDEWGETAEVKGEDGLVLQPYQAAGDMYSLRYEEALCMEAAYQRRRADRAEARLASIEERLAALEAKI